MFIVHYNSHNPNSKMHKFLGTNPRSFFPGVGSAFVCLTAVGCFNSSGTKTRRRDSTRTERVFYLVSKRFASSASADFVKFAAACACLSLICLSSYECCKCICGGKKYKGFVRLILQQGFVQRIAHGFVYMNVQGFVLCARSWWARRAAQGRRGTTSVINSVRQLPFCHQLYLSWPSIYQPLINYSQTTPHLPLHCYSFLLFTKTPGLPEAHILVPKMYKKQREPAILSKDHKAENR